MYLEYHDIKEPTSYCTGIILREAREEDSLVKQVFYTMISAYTNNPFNLEINSPSGEGKSYVLTKVGEVFPKEDVMFLSGMTDKALFHRRGKLVIQNDQNGEYDSIDDRIADIETEIEDKQNEMANARDNNKKQGLHRAIKSLEKDKKDLLKDAKKLIDLSHKSIVFLDTPRPELLSALMPLLSHDKYEVEYEFVDTHSGIKTKSNVLRGWPAVIFAQAIDDTHHQRYPEIRRRFIVTNPKMTAKKYEQAIDLIGDKYGLPDFAYQRKIVSDADKEKVREIIRGINDKVLDTCSGVNPGKNNVTIPYGDIIKSVLSKEKGFDMTTANRLFGFIALLAIVNIDKRPKIVLRKNGDPIIQRIPFASFEDLSEVLSLMDYSADGIRPYLLEWYDNVFLETFSAKREPDSKVNSSRRETITENIIALTSEELAKATFEKQNKKYTTKQIVENFVNPLFNLGYIDKTESNIDKRHNIYYPALVANNIGTKNRKSCEMGQSNNFSQTSKLIVKNSTSYPSKEYLTYTIRQVLEYSSEGNDFSFMQLRP